MRSVSARAWAIRWDLRAARVPLVAGNNNRRRVRRGDEMAEGTERFKCRRDLEGLAGKARSTLPISPYNTLRGMKTICRTWP